MNLFQYGHQLYTWWLRRRENNARHRITSDRPDWTDDDAFTDMRACLKSLQRHRRRHP